MEYPKNNITPEENEKNYLQTVMFEIYLDLRSKTITKEEYDLLLAKLEKQNKFASKES